MLAIFRSPLPLAAHLAAFAALLTLPLVLVTGLVTVRYAEAERGRLEADTRETRDELLVAVDRDLADKVTVLRALATSPALDGEVDLPRLRTLASELSGNRFTVALHDNDGRLQINVATGARRLPGAAPPDPTVVRAAGLRRAVISDLSSDPETGRPVLKVAFPVIRDGTVRSVLAARIQPSDLTALVQSLKVAPPLFGSVVDGLGRVITRSATADEFVGRRLPGFDPDRGLNSTWSGVNLEGIAVLGFSRRSELSGWTVTMSVEQSALEAPLRRSLLWLAALAVALGVAALCAALLLTQRLADAGRFLADAATGLRRGAVITPPVTSVKEANAIGLALSQASVSLREQADLLVRANRELEQRVQERTRELTLARDRAEEAGRVKAEFLANMSHELRTPLTAIMGASELLLSGYATGNPEKQQRYLEMQRDAGQSLLQIINDILDFSKIDAGRLEIELVPVSPREIVDGAIALLAEQATRKGLVLAGDVAPDCPDRVLGDPTRIRQVLLNLLSNAVKFTASGQVRIEVTAVPGDGRQLVRFAVSDTGIGIRAERLELLFGRFTQEDASTSRQFGGSGLGLAISRRLCELMGGTIEVESREREGSTFAFTLPLEPVAGLATANPATRIDRPLRPVRHVLLVEDNETSRQVVSAMLRQEGHFVTEAATGQAALDAVARDRGTLDLVLMDVQMPGMDGYEATRALRRSGCRLPILALTANALPGETEKCLAAGMDGHVTKPVDWPALFAAVAAARGAFPSAVAA